MSIYGKIMRGLVKCEKSIIGLALGMATVIIMISVVGRRIGHAPAWSEEAVRYLMIWITFVGSGLCFRRGNHYGIDVIRRVPNQLFQKFVTIFIFLADAVFAYCLLYYGWRFTSFTMMSHQVTAALRWPAWLVYASTVVGGALVLVHLVEVLLSEFTSYTIEE